MSTQTRPLPASPAGAPPPPRRGPGAWVLVALGGLLAAALVVGGASSLVGAVSREEATGGERVDGVRSVDVVNECAGDVDVTPSAAGRQVRVSWTDSWSLRPPEHSQRLDGDRLVVRVDCPPVSLGWGPTSDLELTVPARATVAVRTGSGDVTAGELEGDADLSTGSGDVTVSGASGDLRVSTGSGNVDAARVTGGELLADTGSGDVRLSAAEPPRTVVADTGSGDVELELPDVAGGYDVRTDTGSGSEDVTVDQDPSSSRSVTVDTGSGDVEVRPAR